MAEKKSAPIVAVYNLSTSNVLYRIVPITKHGKGNSMTEYVLLDEASGPTLIEERILNGLNIHGDKPELCIQWTDGTLRCESDSQKWI